MAADKEDHIDKFHDYGIYLPTRTIEIFGEIDEEMATKVIRNLHILDNTKEGTVTIKLMSEGGCVTSGLAIYDAIRAMKNYVRVICYGNVESMATVVLQAGDERLMTPDSYLMIHEGHQETKVHPKNKKRWDDFIEILDKRCLDIYLEKIKQKKPRFTRKKLQDLLVFDTILQPKQVIELGLADKLIEGTY